MIKLRKYLKKSIFQIYYNSPLIYGVQTTLPPLSTLPLLFFLLVKKIVEVFYNLVKISTFPLLNAVDGKDTLTVKLPLY